MCKEIVSRIESVIDLLNDRLETETMVEVMHYFNHSEYEISFEGLMIDAMSIPIISLPIGFEELKDIAINLKLDKETVLDSDFWMKFLEWGNKTD